MRLAALSLLALCCSAALAQPVAGTPAMAPGPAAPAAPAPLVQEQPDNRISQRIERIRHEDAGARVDELRYGGETQSISVQPKADMPAYQVQPGGTRVWNLFRF